MTPFHLAEQAEPDLAANRVDETDMQRFIELVYERTGIRVPPAKKALLCSRVRGRVRETGVRNIADYYWHLERLSADTPEWDVFLQEITAHQTYLFRDQPQWNWFRSSYLPQLAAAVRSAARPRTLRIWSAACNTGDEAMTAAMCIADCLPNYQHWKIHILGTDIGAEALERARCAVFSRRAMRRVPEDYYRFFTKAEHADIWRAKPVLTEMVLFRQHNLLDPLEDKPFDLVFLKNVLVHFDTESKQRVLEHLCAVVRPGGFLIVGPDDDVTGLLGQFNTVQPWLHERRQ